MKKFILTSLLLLLSLMATAFAQEKYDLRLNLTKGQTFTYQLVENSPITMSVMGQQMEMKQSQTVTYTYTVLDTKEGQYLLQINVNRVQAHTSSTGEEMDIDTDTNAQDVLHGEVRKLVNKPIKQWFDDKFHPIGEPEGDLTDDLKKGILAMVSAPTFFPQEPMTKGESIYVNKPVFSGDAAQGAQFDGVLMLVEVSDADYTLRTNGKVKTVMEGVNLEGNLILTMILDRKTGMIKSTFGTQALKGRATVQGTQMDLTSNAIITMRLL